MDCETKSAVELLDRLSSREREILEHLSSGLTDQQIASDLFLSLNTVKWYNRQIYSKLGVGSRTQAISSAQSLGLLRGGTSPATIGAPAVAPSPPVAVPIAHLPVPADAFIGRSCEIGDVVRLLAGTRLLTLTGPGGIGKTRLALEAAAQMTPAFTDGVCFVNLAPLSEHTLVVNAIASALSIRENAAEPLLATLKSALAKRTLLLLIDNFEHVIEAASLVFELVATSTNLKILVTSREPLHLSGEQQYPVPSLTEFDAESLFVQRARLTSPHFEVNDKALTQICARLDGLPLAIELAAARCKLLSVKALAERLDTTSDATPFDTLGRGPRDAPMRHRSLRDTVAWSNALLNDDEKNLFARLAVFKGSRSLDAIEVVCGAGLKTDVFDVLTALVDKSLVQQESRSNGEPRFMLLETINAYAYEQLEANGEVDEMRRCHAHYFVVLAERAAPYLTTANMWQWMDMLDIEFDNIRVAVNWCHAQDVDTGLRFVSSLHRFCLFRSHMCEANAWLSELLAKPTASLEARALATKAHGTLCYRLQDYALGLAQLSESLSLFTQLQDNENIALVLSTLGNIAFDQGHHSEAECYQRESLALSHEINFAWNIASASNNLALALRMQGRLDEAANCFTESAEQYNQVNDISSAASVVSNMASMFLDMGDCTKAQQLYEASYAQLAIHDDKLRLAYAASGLGDVARMQGNGALAKQRYREGIQLFFVAQNNRDAILNLLNLAALECADGHWPFTRLAELLSMWSVFAQTTHSVIEPREQSDYDQALADAHAALDAVAFDTAWAHGKQVTLKEAVAFVTEEMNSQ